MGKAILCGLCFMVQPLLIDAITESMQWSERYCEATYKPTGRVDGRQTFEYGERCYER